MKGPLIETFELTARTSRTRFLFRELTLQLSGDRVALVGRNGVGKSTLLQILSGGRQPDQGRLVLRTTPRLVPQTLEQGRSTLSCLEQTRIPEADLNLELEAAGLADWNHLCSQPDLSHGERRKLSLLASKLSGAEMLLLDEPTQDLDERGVQWLRNWLKNWSGGLLVASHEAQLLQDFQHFFVMAETGCHYFSGGFSELESDLERSRLASEKSYLQNLNRMLKLEEHTEYVKRRRGRKKQYGRVSELGRATPRKTLNQKRDYAQVKHGKMKRSREAKLESLRQWTRQTRRAMQVQLPLLLDPPQLASSDASLVELRGVSAQIRGRTLFQEIDLRLGCQRLAVVGPNGAGKTTLLEIVLGRRQPSRGRVKACLDSIGSIAQGGGDWMLEQSLVSYLSDRGLGSPGAIAQRLIAHKFPLALGQRPLRSLSPGERVRAALISLFQIAPTVKMLVLDEPTYSLDLLGRKALTEALRAWPGGLMVASHNRSFLAAIGIEEYLDLGSLKKPDKKPQQGS